MSGFTRETKQVDIEYTYKGQKSVESFTLSVQCRVWLEVWQGSTEGIGSCVC